MNEAAAGFFVTRAVAALSAALVMFALKFANKRARDRSCRLRASRPAKQFEKNRDLEFDKVLAAFGGVSVAAALGFTIDIQYNPAQDISVPYLDRVAFLLNPERHVGDLRWGMGAVTMAFVVAVFQATHWRLLAR